MLVHWKWLLASNFFFVFVMLCLQWPQQHALKQPLLIKSPCKKAYLHISGFCIQSSSVFFCQFSGFFYKESVAIECALKVNPVEL